MVMSPLFMQFWVMSGVVITIVGQGFVFTYPYILLPALKGPDSPIPIDLETGSWLASSITVTMIFGTLLSSCMMEWFGRRLSFAIMQVPSIVGWLLIYVGTNITTVMIGRMTTGLGTGAALVIASTILGEYSSPKFRGLFMSFKTTALNIGIITLHVTYDYYSWRTAALFCVLPPVIVLLSTCTWPESPSWLMNKNKIKESEKSFYSLRERNEESEREFEAMIKAQNEKMCNIQPGLTVPKNLCMFLKKFGRKDFVIPVLITFCGFTLLELSGRHVFPSYAQDFIAEIKGDLEISSSSITLCLDFIVIIGTCASCFLTKILMRRFLLFFSGISSIVVLFVTCLYVFLEYNGIILNLTPWIPISMLLCYLFLANLGATTLPLVLYGEIFPLQHRGSCTFVGGVITVIPMLFVLQLTPPMLVSLKFYGTFLVFGLGSVLSLLVLYFILPETKDRTLQEIEDEFNKKKVKSKINNNTENVVGISIISKSNLSEP